MDNGVPPEERRTTSERRATARPGTDRRATPRSRTAPARKSAQQPRKAASSSTLSVADRIDPLMGSQATEVADEPLTERVVPKRSIRPRQAAPRKRTPVVEQPLPNGDVDESTAESRVAAPVPYVLPKIIPAEIEPDTVPAATPDEASVESKAKRSFKPQLRRFTDRFKGSTAKLARSLQPVTLRRHRPRVRRVTRVVRHIDTWSVFKIALLFNVFLYAVCLTAGVMLWRVALNTGTIENVERFFESFGWQTFELKGGEIYHNAWIAGLFGVVGLTGLAVLAATIFNLITDLVGGIRVTVLEEEVTAREPYVVSWPRLMRPGTPPRDQPLDEPRSEPVTD